MAVASPLGSVIGKADGGDVLPGQVVMMSGIHEGGSGNDGHGEDGPASWTRAAILSHGEGHHAAVAGG